MLGQFKSGYDMLGEVMFAEAKLGQASSGFETLSQVRLGQVRVGFSGLTLVNSC
jgi:hypothetical protein